MGKTQSPMIHHMIFPSIPCKNCNFKGYYTVYVILRPISWTGRWHKLGHTAPNEKRKLLTLEGTLHDRALFFSINHSDFIAPKPGILTYSSHFRSFSPRHCSLHPFGSPIVTTWPGALVFPRWWRRCCSRWCSHWRRWSGYRRCTPSPGATAPIWRRWDFSTRTRGDGMELGSEKSRKYFKWMETKAWNAMCVAWTWALCFLFWGKNTEMDVEYWARARLKGMFVGILGLGSFLK